MHFEHQRNQRRKLVVIYLSFRTAFVMLYTRNKIPVPFYESLPDFQEI